MGTALLLGDLPPQMLHSVSGIEFYGFIWHSGRPSSFPILTATYICVLAIFYKIFARKLCAQQNEFNNEKEEPSRHIKDRRFAWIVCSGFIITIICMPVRPVFGCRLGMIALSGAGLLILILEIMKKHMEVPSLEEVLKEMDWRAIFFYILLFALVGGLEKAYVIEAIARWFSILMKSSLVIGTTILFWVSAGICGIVEHDAYILTLLYVIRDLHREFHINPWPLYWSVLWAGTLGSNLTIAGAPALFVAVNLGEKEEKRKATLREFFSYTIPFVLVSLVICYILTIFIWIFP